MEFSHAHLKLYFMFIITTDLRTIVINRYLDIHFS